MRRLRLEPLSEAAVTELARRAGRPAAGLRALTGGNPLLVTEVLAAGDTGVPLTVRDLVLARVGGLRAGRAEVVRLVAVVPTRVELWLLERPRGRRPRRSRRRWRPGCWSSDDDAIGFRHELLRRAVEGSLSVLARRELNRRVLAVLAGATDGPVDVARLVHHAREAGDIDAVLRYAPEAARQAAAVAAHREAVEHYRAVLPHAERLAGAGPRRAAGGLLGRGYLSGLSDEAVTARQAAVALREAAGDRREGRRGAALAVAPALVGRQPAGGGGGRRPRHRRAGDAAARPPARHGLQQPGPARHAGRPAGSRRALGRAGDRAGPAAGRPGDADATP